jgi:hypothetical protein
MISDRVLKTETSRVGLGALVSIRAVSVGCSGAGTEKETGTG